MGMAGGLLLADRSVRAHRLALHHLDDARVNLAGLAFASHSGAAAPWGEFYRGFGQWGICKLGVWLKCLEALFVGRACSGSFDCACLVRCTRHTPLRMTPFCEGHGSTRWERGSSIPAAIADCGLPANARAGERPTVPHEARR
jgi:hypothetical protein